jgi:methionine sulfoxide reductase heme-binding subunit
MTRNQVLKPIVFLACLLPLADLALRAVQGRMGANPIERITHQTGWWTLAFLVGSLSITPLRRLSKVLWLVQYRRMIGLFAFFYGTLHMLTYVWLDQFFDVHAMVHDIAKRPFITMGSLSYLSMIPLALTSTQWSIRKLGKNWVKLHRLAYLAAVAGVIHFLWLVKKDRSEPETFAVVLGLLFAIRIGYMIKERRAKESSRRVTVPSNQRTAEPTTSA